MKLYRTALMALTLTMLPSMAVAHPGHGRPEVEHSVLHYVVSPTHFLPPIIAVGLLVLIVRWRNSLKRNKMIKCPATVAIRESDNVAIK